MPKIPRVRERTATPQELEEDRRRCAAARTKPPTPAPAAEGNLVKCLVVFARWRTCSVCRSRPLLFVDARCRTDADVECPTCQRIREDLAKRLKPSLPLRAALHLRAIFEARNDNGVALMGGG